MKRIFSDQKLKGLANTNESYPLDEIKTKGGSSNKRTCALHDGTKNDTSDAVKFLSYQ
jgi:hypothetical protein